MKPKDLLGGQALLDGVMMKGPKKIAYAVYDPHGVLQTKVVPFISITKRFKILGLPIVRGFVSMIEMMVVGVNALQYSVSIALPDEKQNAWDGPISLLISVLFSIFLFMVMPAAGFTFLKPYIANTLVLNLIEGILRLSIFLGFLLLMNLMADMRHLFGFHGAEHMTVYAYENGEKLTLENVAKYSPLHPRCGTSFLLIVMTVSIVVFSFLGRPDLLHRIAYKLLLLPFISGVSYELIRFAVRLPKPFMLTLTAPGLFLQKLTTRRPDAKMITAAIAALKLVQEKK